MPNECRLSVRWPPPGLELVEVSVPSGRRPSSGHVGHQDIPHEPFRRLIRRGKHRRWHTILAEVQFACRSQVTTEPNSGSERLAVDLLVFLKERISWKLYTDVHNRGTPGIRVRTSVHGSQNSSVYLHDVFIVLKSPGLPVAIIKSISQSDSVEGSVSRH